MKTKLALLAPALAVASVMLAGCSNKATYDNLQHNQRMRCLEKPYAQHLECMDDTSKSYEEYQDDLEEYERERRKIENEKMLEEGQG